MRTYIYILHIYILHIYYIYICNCIFVSVCICIHYPQFWVQRWKALGIKPAKKPVGSPVHRTVAIEIVSFPLKNGDFPYPVVMSTFTRGYVHQKYAEAVDRLQDLPWICPNNGHWNRPKNTPIPHETPSWIIPKDTSPVGSWNNAQGLVIAQRCRRQIQIIQNIHSLRSLAPFVYKFYNSKDM